MKKYILFLLIALCLPVSIMADTVENIETGSSNDSDEGILLEVTDLETTLSLEGMEISDPNYLEEQTQANIYMFRGSGCSHCRDFLTFLNDSLAEYGKYFRLRAYEVWENDDNAKLMEDAAEVLDTEIEGVPFIIIGKEYFFGYSESMKDDIIAAIKKEYEAEEKTNIIDLVDEADLNKKDQDFPIIICVGLVIVGLVVAIVWAKNKTKEAN